MNCVVRPCGTATFCGEMPPPAPAAAVTANVGNAVKNAVTVQSVAIAPVFQVVGPVIAAPPLNTTPQPVTLTRRKPRFGVTVMVGLLPNTTR